MPSNTAFRGFGAPQAHLCAEKMVRHIAESIGKDYMEIQKINMFKEGDAVVPDHVLEDYNQLR